MVKNDQLPSQLLEPLGCNGFVSRGSCFLEDVYIENHHTAPLEELYPHHSSLASKLTMQFGMISSLSTFLRMDSLKYMLTNIFDHLIPRIQYAQNRLTSGLTPIHLQGDRIGV